MDKVEKLELDILERRMEMLQGMLEKIGVEMQRLDDEVWWWQKVALAGWLATFFVGLAVIGGLL